MAGRSSAPGVFRVGSCVLYGAVVLLRRHRMPPAPHRLLRAATGLAVLIATTIANAQPAETVGTVAVLPEQAGPHWFWLSDIILHRTALFDADTGELLGTISSGTAGRRLRHPRRCSSPDHREIYLAETLLLARRARRAHRRRHGLRRRARSQPLHEIGIPPKRAEYFPGNAANALSDDGRFMAVFNLTPMTSLSIVDVQARALRRRGADARAAASSTPPARGASSCCAPTARRSPVDARRRRRQPTVARSRARSSTRRRTRSPRRRSGAATSGSSCRSTGMVHADRRVGRRRSRFGEPWPLFDDADRAARGASAAASISAVHAPYRPALRARCTRAAPTRTRRPGTEVWVYDLATRRRVQRIPMLNPLVSFVGAAGGLDAAHASGASALAARRRCCRIPASSASS